MGGAVSNRGGAGGAPRDTVRSTSVSRPLASEDLGNGLGCIGEGRGRGGWGHPWAIDRGFGGRTITMRRRARTLERRVRTITMGA